MGIIYTILIGAICGFIADAIVGGKSGGLLVTIIIGIIGSFIGAWIFTRLGIYINTGYSFLNDILIGACGAIVFLLIAILLTLGRRRRRY